MSDSEEAMALVCTLPKGLQSERRIDIQRVFEGHRAFRAIAHGVEVDFGASEEIARTLLDFVLFERVCCNSFTYELRFETPHRVITLRLTAAEEQVAALQALYRSLTLGRKSDARSISCPERGTTA